MTHWHTFSTENVAEQLTTDLEQGLTLEQSSELLVKTGPNEMREIGRKPWWRILWEQFTSTMVLILIAAGVLSLILKDFKDAIAIFAIVVLYAVLGFVQEYRAEQAIAALKRLAVPVVKVIRAGQVQEISARLLVPGDIVLLEAGNLVPADCRVLESINLRAQEAALTGESEPVEKTTAALANEELALGDRRNMVYMGTTITAGRGQAVVVQTGMTTELGKIAALIQSAESGMTPLQRRLDVLSKRLALVALAVAALVFLLGILRQETVDTMLLTAISIAVAVVPEGLPAVVTITLALGAQKMLRRRALIRKLPAVETLGSITVICSDKTGTLTENRMTVTVLDVAGHSFEITEEMRRRMPVFDHADPIQAQVRANPSLTLLLSGGTLCNDAQIQPAGDDGQFRTIGDPTEGALLVAAAAGGLSKSRLEAVAPRVGEIAFDSNRKRMTTLHALSGEPPADLLPLPAHAEKVECLSFTKGSVDGLLEISSCVWVDGELHPLEDSWRARILNANNRMAANGVRVLGVAFRMWDHRPESSEMEQGLTFVGMTGMMDPPRAEVRDAVQTCLAAGIRPIMITGDHPLTAQAIARELGILKDGSVLTGQELDRLTPDELKRRLDVVSVFARVSPENKLQIVQALQERGEIVAMTGDGVNDAPALKRADIGVAMGITGTDVSKEASSMILLDDNFATIVAAVEEGRTIYENLKKFLKFSLAGNLGKVLVALITPLVILENALLPVQLLWLNLLTDGLLGLGLGMEPAERGTMRRKPYSPNENILAGKVLVQIITSGLIIGLPALAVAILYFMRGSGAWQTMLFTTLAFAQIGQAFAVRTGTESLFSAGLLSNKPLLGFALATLLLQLAVLFFPPLREFLMASPLSLPDILIAAGVGLAVFLVLEVEKRAYR